MAMHLTPTDRAILVDLLENGDNTSGNIHSNIDAHRTHVSKRLGVLSQKGLVEDKGGGVYRLTREGIAVARTLTE